MGEPEDWRRPVEPEMAEATLEDAVPAPLSIPVLRDPRKERLVRLKPETEPAVLPLELPALQCRFRNSLSSCMASVMALSNPAIKFHSINSIFISIFISIFMPFSSHFPIISQQIKSEILSHFPMISPCNYSDYFS